MTAVEPKLTSPELPTVARLLFRHQVWRNHHCNRGLVAGVEDGANDATEIINFRACHSSTLHQITPNHHWHVGVSLEKLPGAGLGTSAIPNIM